jgi:hypothetical protein
MRRKVGRYSRKTLNNSRFCPALFDSIPVSRRSSPRTLGILRGDRPASKALPSGPRAYAVRSQVVADRRRIRSSAPKSGRWTQGSWCRIRRRQARLSRLCARSGGPQSSPNRLLRIRSALSPVAGPHPSRVTADRPNGVRGKCNAVARRTAAATAIACKYREPVV